MLLFSLRVDLPVTVLVFHSCSFQYIFFAPYIYSFNHNIQLLFLPKHAPPFSLKCLFLETQYQFSQTFCLNHGSSHLKEGISQIPVSPGKEGLWGLILTAKAMDL